ncbi:hypothetical protein M408DRAFT_74190 [Serendipita vermifera MAFF 305830]|uniref:Cleavage and polyadenylation specificity factor subunit 2 n=1 Tax=Serendipita vermifera MAFF 305830 TaxID=933852 RepID=A0A0C2X8M0_SERVB|nr:hypothetical protein M408DRAFT_74190 [Serendipita vermifera MAFF 305830]
MITFTPLAGSARSDAVLPLAYVLEIDDVKILLDCGSPDWHPDEDLKVGEQATAFREEYCDQLKRHAPTIDLVLLSHGDLAHAGLYAHAHAHWGLTATTYTTLPVQAMAKIAALEEAIDIRNEEDVNKPPEPAQADGMDTTTEELEPPKRSILVPTIEEINEAFQSIITLRYSQPTHLAGKCHGITITPYAAGHTIGGTIWKIRSPSAGTLVYAVNLNHLKERHLDGSVLTLSTGGGVFEPLARPDVLITDAERALTIGGKRKDRDKALLDIITETIASGHSLLLPVDSSTRLLELLVLTDQHWAYSRIRAPICLISNTSKELLAVVRSMMEWLGGTISKEDVGDTGRNVRRRRDEDDEALGALALRFKFIEMFGSPDQLVDKFSSRDPKLILAVPASMSHGASRSLFADFARVEGNMVVLTERAERGTLNKFLMDRWEAAQEESQRWQDGKLGEPIALDRPIELELRSKVLLQGEELEKFREKEAQTKEKIAAEKAAAARKQQMREEEAESSDSGSGDSDDSGSDEEATNEMKNEIDGVNWTALEQEDAGLKLQSFDIYVKGHQTKTSNFFKTNDAGAPRFRMFPFVEKKRRFDDFGEIIDVSSWLRKGKMLDQNAESDEAKAARLKKTEDEKKIKAPEEAPSKFIKEQITIDMRCKVHFIDLEGVHDGRALKNILPHINPRRMVIVQASPEATESLIESCKATKSMTTEVYAPSIGETVRIGEDMRNFTVALSDALMSSIKMSVYEDSEIAFIKGRISLPTNSGIPVLEPLRISNKGNEDVEMENGDAVTEKSTVPRAVMIGDLKLTSLKNRLNRLGISADFAGEGILVCRSTVDDEEDTVAVRKTRKGQVRVEGDASTLFYAVREEIYKLHALVETE